MKSSLEDRMDVPVKRKTIRLNAFVSTLTWELEKSYRVASIAGGPVAS